MNWDLFLQFVFALHVIGYACGVFAGLLEIPKATIYSRGYAAFSAIFLVVMILMWYWT